MPEASFPKSSLFPLKGRRPIYTEFSASDLSDPYIVAQVLAESWPTHAKNAEEIQYLYDVYLGRHDIYDRVKQYNDHICNRIVSNIAYEIVEFKKGYEFSMPAQFISRTEGNETSKAAEMGADRDKLGDSISKISAEMMSIGKDSIDKEIAEWFYICGQSYRYSNFVPSGSPQKEKYIIASLDPRCSFVVHSDDPGKETILGVYYTEKTNKKDKKKYRHFYAHTSFGCFEYEILVDDLQCIAYEDAFDYKKFKQLGPVKLSRLGSVPIVEYLFNNSRLGAFEVVLGLINEKNTLLSNRVDAVEQAVQALIVLTNVDLGLDKDGNAIGLQHLREKGFIAISSPQGLQASVQIMETKLDQNSVETAIQSLMDDIESIVGIPNRQSRAGGGGDTGQAVALRDGWAGAEVRAQSTESMFRRSERLFIPQVIKLLDLDIDARDVDEKFARNRSDNLLVKAQSFSELVATGVDPESAIEICGFSSDANALYDNSPGLQLKYDEASKALEDLKSGKTDEIMSDSNIKNIPSSRDNNIEAPKALQG